MGSGAQAQGKALAFSGEVDDVTAASHNPGGLVQIERPEVSIVGSYFLRFEQQDVTRPNPGASGMRDPARVLPLSTTTVSKELKKHLISTN